MGSCRCSQLGRVVRSTWATATPRGAQQPVSVSRLKLEGSEEELRIKHGVGGSIRRRHRQNPAEENHARPQTLAVTSAIARLRLGVGRRQRGRGGGWKRTEEKGGAAAEACFWGGSGKRNAAFVESKLASGARTWGGGSAAWSRGVHVTIRAREPDAERRRDALWKRGSKCRRFSSASASLTIKF